MRQQADLKVEDSNAKVDLPAIFQSMTIFRMIVVEVTPGLYAIKINLQKLETVM